MADSELPVVLVVEDERGLADLYTDWLAGSADVRTAYDGTEALELVDETVDVALLDRRLPGASGDEILAEIRDRDLECRVAMVTAIEPDFDIVEMGFDEYLVKPISATELQQTVDRMQARSSYDERLREYYALLSKKSALESQKSARALANSEAYARLARETAAAEERLDDALDEMGDLDFRIALRDIDGESSVPTQSGQ